MVISADYRHKIFDVRDRQSYYLDMKGTLTPPGSSPLHADSTPHMPMSPEAPPTPDSAHMTGNLANTTLEDDPEDCEMTIQEEESSDDLVTTNHSKTSEYFSSNKESYNEGYLSTNPEASEKDIVSKEYLSTNEQPLTGAKKRKASKVHKVETLCSRDDGESSSLTCPVCNSMQASQHEFTRHIRTHNRVIEANHGLKMYECGICKKQLSSNSSLDRHMLVHSGERPFRCHICGTHFTTNGNMHRHIRGHYRNNGGACTGSDTGDSDCSDGEPSFPKKRELEDKEDEVGGKLPRFSDDDENSKDISCPACGLEQISQQVLEYHVETEHPEYQVSCSTCHIGFKSYRALHLHNSMVHRSQTSPPRLDLIDFTSSKFPLYAKEVCEAEADESKEHAYKCHMCAVSFPCAESWILHMKDHSTNTTQLTCRYCDVTVSSIAELAQHNERHQNEGKQPPKDHFFAALDLKQRAALFANINTSSSLPSHITSLQTPHMSTLPRLPPINHLPKSEPMNIVAQLPPSSIATPVTSQSHEDQFTRDYKDMKLNGQYPCRICREVFANLRKLKSHNLVHMMSPPYRCNLCTFYSNDKNTLKEHMKSHRGDTPFECTLCGLAFTTKANCERHIKNIHGRQTRDEVKLCMNFNPSDDTSSISDRTTETVCHLCKIDCKTRSVLRDHMRSSHPEGINQPYACKVCHNTFPSHNDTFRHMIQSHPEIATGGSVEGLIIERKSREEVQDLSSIESILSFSQIPLPINTVPPTQRPISTLSITPNMPNIQNYSSGLSIRPPTVDISPSISITPTNHPPISSYMPRCISPVNADEETPLDLSVTKKNNDNIEESKYDTETPVITLTKSTKVEVNDDEPEDLSKSKTINQPTSSPDSSSESSPGDILKIPRPNFPLMYPSSLPIYPFHQQYPLLMNPFNRLSQVTNINPTLLCEYQKSLKNRFPFSTGGALLNNGGGLLPNNNPPFQISSALALAADQLKIPNLSKTSSESRDDYSKDSENLNSSTNAASEDDMLHFTMRNSVLVKKPKQRRYRTERPWRCDLCDKGFTLRSNMERHMKQQHPDVWQQRPKPPGTPKSICSLNSDQSTILNLTRVEKDGTESVNLDEVSKEEDDTELIIDDSHEEADNEDDLEDCDDEEDEDKSMRRHNENHADLASVHKLLSTASHIFPFFNKEEEENCDGDSSDNCLSSDDGKKSAYSSAPQKQKCPYCSRKFPWSSSLVRHIRTHTGQKPYLCPVCHFPFTTKSNCDRHLQRKHPDTPVTLAGDRPYRCVKCPGAAFTSLESLKKHEVVRHEKANDTFPAPPQSGNIKCHVCDASIPTSQEALDHVAKHHPEQLTTLPPALIATKSNNELAVSSPDSTTSDVVSCLICSKNCSNVAALTEHVKEAHTTQSFKEILDNCSTNNNTSPKNEEIPPQIKTSDTNTISEDKNELSTSSTKNLTALSDNNIVLDSEIEKESETVHNTKCDIKIENELNV